MTTAQNDWRTAAQAVVDVWNSPTFHYQDMSAPMKALAAALAAEKQRNDDIRETLCAALLSDESASIALLTGTEANDLSWVLRKALAAPDAGMTVEKCTVSDLRRAAAVVTAKEWRESDEHLIYCVFCLENLNLETMRIEHKKSCAWENLRQALAAEPENIIREDALAAAIFSANPLNSGRITWDSLPDNDKDLHRRWADAILARFATPDKPRPFVCRCGARINQKQIDAEWRKAKEESNAKPE